MTDIDEIESRLQKYNLKNSDNLLKFKKVITFDTIKSDLICIEYSDKLFISVTSNARFGSVIIVKSEKVSGLEETIYTVKNLFGQYEPTFQVFARSLAEKLKLKHSVNKPVLLSIGVTKEQINRIDLFKDYENKILEFFTE